MIKCGRIDGTTTAAVGGRITEITEDFCETIAAVYRTLHPGVRDLFKSAIILAVAHEESPMWRLNTGDVRVVESVTIALSEAKRQARKKEDT